MTASTGLDEALKLEAVYYSAPVPRDLATLTVLGTVFDKFLIALSYKSD